MATAGAVAPHSRHSAQRRDSRELVDGGRDPSALLDLDDKHRSMLLDHLLGAGQRGELVALDVDPG